MLRLPDHHILPFGEMKERILHWKGKPGSLRHGIFSEFGFSNLQRPRCVVNLPAKDVSPMCCVKTVAFG